MIKVDMSSPDLDKQLLLLKYYPEYFKKHFRPTLYRNVTRGKQLTAAGVPKRTGRAAAALKSKVTGTGINMEGHFGWYGNDMPWYINIVEYGAKPHEILPKKPGGWLRIGDTFTRKVQHPGFAGRKFMAAAYAALKPALDADLLIANEAVLKELVVT
jgi:hypothetical protein